MTARARYDGHADWYDTYNAVAAEANRVDLLRLLGTGTGLCLDLGCGTGLYAEALRMSGRTVIGVDYSADQLRIAGTRVANLIRADAAALPFADDAFPTVVALWVSTDMDQFGAVLREAARVLQPGGLLLFYGVHPCFNGPHTEMHDDGLIVHGTYRLAGWHDDAPWWGQNLRRRLGMRHVPLAELLTAFIDAGLTITRVVEPREDLAIPSALAVLARPSVT